MIDVSTHSRRPQQEKVLQQIASAVAAGSAEAALAALRAENARLQQERDDIRSIQEERAHIEHERFLLVRTPHVVGREYVCGESVCSVCVYCSCVSVYVLCVCVHV